MHAFDDQVSGREFEIVRWTPGQAPPEALDAVRAMRARAFAGMFPEPDAETLARRRREGVAWWVEGQWVVADRTAPAAAMMHVVRHGGAAVAVANTFRRVMHTEHGEIEVLALAGVGSDPSVRGRGFGKAAICDAFRRLDEDGLTHCLFQTGKARPLYEKLGATRATNRFVDRTAEDVEAHPWEDDWVMRFPAAADWPEGVIDLNGGSY